MDPYETLANELFTPTVSPVGCEDVSTNMDALVDINWDKVTLTTLQRHPVVLQHFKDAIDRSINSCLGSLQMLVPTPLPDLVLYTISTCLERNYDFIKTKLVAIWKLQFSTQLLKLKEEEEFDLMWYDMGSSDYSWASHRIDRVDELLARTELPDCNQAPPPPHQQQPQQQPCTENCKVNYQDMN